MHNPGWVKELREKKGWNRKRLAEYLGVSPRTVEGWENDTKPRTISPMAISQLRRLSCELEQCMLAEAIKSSKKEVESE